MTEEKITRDYIDSLIVGEQYYVFPRSTVTVCCIHLKNGYCVIGSSACASRDIFDKEIGEKVARSDAVSKIWELEGYLLRQRLMESSGNKEAS